MEDCAKAEDPNAGEASLPVINADAAGEPKAVDPKGEGVVLAPNPLAPNAVGLEGWPKVDWPNADGVAV